MKVLVTGKRGQLVQSLIERAKTYPNIEIVAVGRPELDLERPGSVSDVLRGVGADAVINAAAYTAVDLAEDEPERAMRINGEAAGELAVAARAIGAPIIHLSTDYVFDGCAAEPYSVGAPTNPLSIYGRSKLQGEELVRLSNPDHVVVRTAWVYSPFGSNFVKTMMRLGQTRHEVSVVSDQIGNPTSALDLADGLLTMITRWIGGEDIGLGETYHLAGKGSASWADLAHAVFEERSSRGFPQVAARRIPTAEWPTKAHRPRNSQLDSSKFSKDVDYEMPHWRDSVASTVSRLLETEALA